MMSNIGKIYFSEGVIRDIEKSNKLNYGTFYQANVWIASRHPIAVRTMLGEKQVRAIDVSLGDSRASRAYWRGFCESHDSRTFSNRTGPLGARWLEWLVASDR